MKHGTHGCQIAIPFTNMEQTLPDAPNAKEEAKGLDSRCNILVYSKRHRLADPDGVSGKAAIDGLVLRGILANDSAKEVCEVRYRQEKIPTAEAEETYLIIDY